ncbi:DNA-3-methyladenine glycosylase family protein [Sporomusa carbonis]|uniref:DNA-3-methyladenine glycosylase family protein n=1 Tax=Sporomusa carbonis TaxID=3076075 RepID=UPI003C7D25E3
MCEIIKQYGPCTLEPKQQYFSLLCQSIISQQLAAKAADAINHRFITFYGGNPTPDSVADTSWEELRSLGLSGQKTGYILDLARKTLDGTVTPDSFSGMPDEDIIKQLIAVKGIGLWTAQIFLIFALNRPDVFPSDDLGLKKAVQKLYNLDVLPNKILLSNISEKWRPYRTTASWYLWRSLENK